MASFLAFVLWVTPVAGIEDFVYVPRLPEPEVTCVVKTVPTRVECVDQLGNVSYKV